MQSHDGCFVGDYIKASTCWLPFTKAAQLAAHSFRAGTSNKRPASSDSVEESRVEAAALTSRRGALLWTSADVIAACISGEPADEAAEVRCEALARVDGWGNARRQRSTAGWRLGCDRGTGLRLTADGLAQCLHAAGSSAAYGFVLVWQHQAYYEMYECTGGISVLRPSHSYLA